MSPAIRQAAAWIGESKRVMSLWTMGLNQSTHGTWHTNAICNPPSATGKIVSTRQWPFPLRANRTPWADAKRGISVTVYRQRIVTKAKIERSSSKFLEYPAGQHSFRPGAEAGSMFQKLESGEIKTIWIMGTNPVASMPKRSRVIHALERKRNVSFVQDAYHPTENFAPMPTSCFLRGWAEAEGTMVNSEKNGHPHAEGGRAAGRSEADWEIVVMVARAMGFGDALPTKNAGEVFDEIRHKTANSHTGYDLRGNFV